MRVCALVTTIVTRERAGTTGRCAGARVSSSHTQLLCHDADFIQFVPKCSTAGRACAGDARVSTEHAEAHSALVAHIIPE